MKKKLFVLFLIAFSATVISGQKIRILTNHLGYNPVGSKNAVIQSYQGDEIKKCLLRSDYDDKQVLELKPVFIGKVDNWKNWLFWNVDFSSFNKEGEYYLECETNKGIVKSFVFRIQNDIYERHTIADLISYFRGQRSIGQFEKADKKIPLPLGQTGTVDLHGGWQDASGDYGKHFTQLSFSTYFNTQQIPLVAYTLAKSYDALNKRNNENFNQLKRRLIDELLYGADYLTRMKVKDGSFYLSVSAPGPLKKPEDRKLSMSMRGSDPAKSMNNDKTKTETILNYTAGYREGAGLAIASLAMASQLNVSGDFESADYLKAAEDAFNYLEKNNLLFTNDGKENIVDDYCALPAATELYKATKKEIYKIAADKRAASLIARLASWGKYSNFFRADDHDRPFFNPSDAGLPVTSLIYYLDICDNTTKERILEAVKKSLQFEIQITNEVPNPFGLARQLVQHIDGKRNSAFFFPHDTETGWWWQGENSRLGSLACAARLAMPYFKNDVQFYNNLERYSNNQINWILGLNPYNSSMMTGVGYNNIEYMYLGSYQYKSIPGGIINGITAGLTDENDIDYNIPYSVTGKDDDWRWEEQWIPHSSWFLIAVSVGI